jgi:hypothetical protein
MDKIWGNFSQGDKHKSALMQAGVGNLQIEFVGDPLTIEEDIQINQARPVPKGLLSAHLSFDQL